MHAFAAHPDVFVLAIALMLTGALLLYGAVIVHRQDQEIARLKGEKPLG